MGRARRAKLRLPHPQGQPQGSSPRTLDLDSQEGAAVCPPNGQLEGGRLQLALAWPPGNCSRISGIWK